MDMEQIKMLCKDATIEVTQHILTRCRQRNITYEEVKEVIWDGDIYRRISRRLSISELFDFRNDNKRTKNTCCSRSYGNLSLIDNSI